MEVMEVILRWMPNKSLIFLVIAGANFAQELGVDENTAASGLSNMILSLIDGNSNGISLLDSLCGSDMIGSLAKGALGSFFK